MFNFHIWETKTFQMVPNGKVSLDRLCRNHSYLKQSNAFRRRKDIFCLQTSEDRLNNEWRMRSKAFILSIQHVGSRHLNPESRDVEYERICEYFMKVCLFFFCFFKFYFSILIF